MKVGVIGSGAIGPDLAYGFVSALAGKEGSKVTLVDIRQEALDAGIDRIKGYVGKGLDRGKLNPKAAKAIEAALFATTRLADLADCDYVLEAATEDLTIKQAILADLEKVVSPDCLIGFATSGLPRSRIAAKAEHPDRCFVNHPFFPAWRALPIEVVLSPDTAKSEQMVATLSRLGKVPIVTADVVCFAADDVFCNYCAEAARIVAEGIATPAQVDDIVNEAVGGGGPFNVMDLTRGNLLNVKCLKLMEEAETGSDWFAPPPIFSEQANTPWHDRKHPGDPSHDEALAETVRNRILAVLLARTFFVLDNDICSARELNWLTRNALGYRQGLLDLAVDMGMDRVHAICAAYAKDNPGFELPPSVAAKKVPEFYRNIDVELEGDIAMVRVQRPEAMNALSKQTMLELETAFAGLEADSNVKGVVLSSGNGALAGADITELAALPTPKEAVAMCRFGHAILDKISAMKTPVVAAVNGPVLGGGSELSMACHARVVGRGLMLGQPEVNLGIIPGYGGTQRLPRLIGVERGFDLLRTGRPIVAKEACAWGWATGEPEADFVGAAKALLRRHIAGELKLKPVDPSPMELPAKIPPLDIGHHSLAIDEIIIDVIREGLATTLDKALIVEAEGFGRCKRTVDFDIGMKNFLQNGPRVPAVFMHE
jgi:enoyl-CoA hydratase/3-hydroxyacyl-CoA dehydrogenase